LGFEQVRQRGSHIVLQRAGATCVVPVRKEVRLGTLSGVLEQAEVPVDELLEALK
jgi:predicted RNA binding protein YcfA (HicA-like mRNA interferase family)